MESIKYPYVYIVSQAVMSSVEMLVGTVLTAAAFGLFIIPQGFASAGVTGLASVVSSYLPLPLAVMVFAVNMLFLVLGFLYVGKAFAVKTIASSVLFPVFLQAFSFSDTAFPGSPMLSVLIAGTLMGVGTGLLLHSGASSGGFAVLGVLFKNKWNVPVALTLNITDAAIILIQMFRQTLSQTVYGILTISLSAFFVNRMLTVQNS